MSISYISHFTETIPDGVSFDMIRVEGGTFMMGSETEEADEDESPIHEVSLASFCIGQYPVSQRLWEAVMGTNPSFFKGLDRPVERVSWEDCQKFLRILKIQIGKTYRLPTEAEWEFAARGGIKSKGFTYAGSNKLKEVAWYSNNSHEETKAIGQKQPNELGIYDMSGNVYEWCLGWFNVGYYQECIEKNFEMNPLGPGQGPDRVPRGGGWYRSPQGCRVAYRSHWRPEDRGLAMGFRLTI